MLEYMFSLTSFPALCIFALTLGVAYVIKSWLSHPSDLPPMPCLPLPIFGHMLYFKPTKREAMMKWKKEAGDIFSMYMGTQLAIVMSSQPLLNEALVKQGDIFTDRPFDFRCKLWEEHSYGIAQNNGSSWKEQRTVCVSILKDLGMGKNWLAEKINTEVDKYVQTLADMKGQASDIRVLTNTAVSNVICALLLGERFDYKDPFLNHFVHESNQQMIYLGKTNIIRALPWLQHLPRYISAVKEWHKSVLHLNGIFSNEFINQFKDNADDTTTDNFIKAYLREMYKRAKSDPSNGLSEIHLRRIIDLLFLGGTDTTSTTLLWAFAFSIRYPDCQKKIYKEILEEVGTERIPNIQDKPKLKYLNAFILESQRLGSVVPFGVNHKCSKTTQVGGYRIPEGAIIVPYLDGVLKDEKVWKDATTFRPDRFLTKDGNLFIPKDFLPFSLGRRVCLGESLAKMELFLFLSIIFQRFEVLPEDPNKLPQLVPSKTSAIGSLVPYRLRMKERTRL